MINIKNNQKLRDQMMFFYGQLTTLEHENDPDLVASMKLQFENFIESIFIDEDENIDLTFRHLKKLIVYYLKLNNELKKDNCGQLNPENALHELLKIVEKNL